MVNKFWKRSFNKQVFKYLIHGIYHLKPVCLIRSCFSLDVLSEVLKHNFFECKGNTVVFYFLKYTVPFICYMPILECELNFLSRKKVCWGCLPVCWKKGINCWEFQYRQENLHHFMN